MPAWRKISLWMDQLDDPLVARPSLEHDLDVNVAIIGAGYTGLWTAYYLKRQAPELKIAIIEAQTAGFGASGRNGGWLMGNLSSELNWSVIAVAAALVLAARGRREFLALLGMFLAGEIASCLVLPLSGWQPAPRFVEAV